MHERYPVEEAWDEDAGLVTLASERLRAWTSLALSRVARNVADHVLQK